DATPSGRPPRRGLPRRRPPRNRHTTSGHAGGRGGGDAPLPRCPPATGCFVAGKTTYRSFSRDTTSSVRCARHGAVAIGGVTFPSQPLVRCCFSSTVRQGWARALSPTNLLGGSPSGIHTASSSPTSARPARPVPRRMCRSEEHTSELQSREKLVCRLLLAKKKQ